MITFARGEECFNFRVAEVAINNNRVLLHTTGKDDFWSFPGSRVEMGETSSQALIREMKEELNEDIEIVRLLWIVENFFILCSKKLSRNLFLFIFRDD